MARQCCLLLLVTGVTMMAFGVAGASMDVTGGYLLYDCEPDPRRSTIKGTAFGASLRPLLAALPSVAAPAGFASLRSSRGNGTAFARGVCFGESPARGDCRECLATAVERIGMCEGDPHRRGAFWNDGCFLAYSDANTTEEDGGDERRWMSFVTHDPAVYPRFYDVETLAGLARSLVPRAAANATLQANGTARMLAAASAALRANSTVRAVAQCPPWNVTAAECALCLHRSVQDFPEILKTYEGARPGVASVHRYRCNLRFEISAPELLPVGVEARIRKRLRNYLIVFVVGAVAIVAAIIAGVVLLVMKRKKKKRKEAQADISTTPS